MSAIKTTNQIWTLFRRDADYRYKAVFSGVLAEVVEEVEKLSPASRNGRQSIYFTISQKSHWVKGDLAIFKHSDWLARTSKSKDIKASLGDY